METVSVATIQGVRCYWSSIGASAKNSCKHVNDCGYVANACVTGKFLHGMDKTSSVKVTFIVSRSYW